MSTGTKIAKNAAWLMVATTLQKLVSFFAFIVVARLVGREQIGIYFYSVSITSIFVVLGDLGMTQVLIRAIASNREDGGHLLGAALRTKALLIPLAVVCSLGYAIMFGADATTLLTVLIACGVMAADSLHVSFYGALRGRQNLKPEAIGMFVGQLFTAVISVTAAWLGWGPVGLAIALFAGSAWNVAWSLVRTRQLEVKILRPRRMDYAVLARESVPFGLAGLAVKVYSYVDSLFIRQFHGALGVGTYAVAYKLTYALQFLPLTFSAALYPALAASFTEKNDKDLRAVFWGSMRLMAALAFPVSALLSALSPRFITLLYGRDFASSSSVLGILAWVSIPYFLDFPIGALLNATHRAHLKTIAMVTTMVINVALNALFVPHFGPVGAAWAGVATAWSLYATGLWLARGLVGGVWPFVALSARTGIAAGVSWYAWRVIGGSMPFALDLVFGCAVAVCMGFAVGLVTVADVLGFVKRFKLAPQKVEVVHE